MLIENGIEPFLIGYSCDRYEFRTERYIQSIFSNKVKESILINSKDILPFQNLKGCPPHQIPNPSSLYYFNKPQKLFDVNFIQHTHKVPTNCSEFYYAQHYYLPNVNYLIPISKHYEEWENTFDIVAPLISSFTPNDQFSFNNERATNVFYQLESNGIKLNKDCFIDYYQGRLPHPEFNLSRGKIYTHYNLYTTTSRPSNTFNSVNFAALNKDDGERMCYMPENDMFIEMDFQGYHPRLIGEMVNFDFPKALPIEINNIINEKDYHVLSIYKNTFTDRNEISRKDN